jgi:phospholipid-transporting ATPase
MRGQLRSEQPNNSLYTYSATLELTTSSSPIPKQIPVGPDQVLLRGAQIRNTPWLFGLVVFTGHQTKLMRNATAAPIKRTNVEREVNTHILFLFVMLLVLSLVSTVGSSIRTWFFSDKLWYLVDANVGRSRGPFSFSELTRFVLMRMVQHADSWRIS